MEPQLISAIEGDSIAFAIARPGDTAQLKEVRRFPVSTFATFTCALQSYTRSVSLPVDGVDFCLAVAGVSRGYVISLPNCRWFISVSGLRAFLRTDPLIINDFAATAWAVPGAEASQLVRAGAMPIATARPGGTHLIVGTGSGLGMGVLSVREDGRIIVLESEGGHASFARENAQEDALLAAMRRRFPHVSFERMRSRPGLENIYAFLAEEDGRILAEPPRAERIIASAISCRDPLAVRAGRMFAAILGSFVGRCSFELRRMGRSFPGGTHAGRDAADPEIRRLRQAVCGQRPNGTVARARAHRLARQRCGHPSRRSAALEARV